MTWGRPMDLMVRQMFLTKDSTCLRTILKTALAETLRELELVRKLQKVGEMLSYRCQDFLLVAVRAKRSHRKPCADVQYSHSRDG